MYDELILSLDDNISTTGKAMQNALGKVFGSSYRVDQALMVHHSNYVTSGLSHEQLCICWHTSLFVMV